MKAPNMEEQYAYDICAVTTQDRGGPTILVVQKPYQACELLKRLESASLFVPEEVRAQFMQDWQETINVDFENWLYSQYNRSIEKANCIIWVYPKPDTIKQTLNLVDALEPGGTLCIMLPGRLARLFTHLQPIDRTQAIKNLNQILEDIRLSGLSIQKVYGIRGVKSFVSGVVASILTRFGFNYEADEHYIKIRQNALLEGTGAFWSAITVIIAAKTSVV